MLTPLDRKLLRDLGKMKGQVFAVSLVMACGLAMMIMTRSLILTLETTRVTYEQRYAMADIFATLADELEIDFSNAGSTTFDRQDLEKALEPDTCFYVEQADVMRGKKRINPLTDPPPELVIEVDVSSTSLNKLPIYASLGVSEIWRWRWQGTGQMTTTAEFSRPAPKQ